VAGDGEAQEIELGAHPVLDPALVCILFLGDPASIVRILSIVLIIAGVVGLNLAGGAAREKEFEDYSAVA